MSSKILLTGGAGYIGSHTYVALMQAGFTPVILDNFCNSHRGVLPRLQQITGQPVLLEEGDVGDTAFVQDVLKRHNITAVVHFAALKSVGESVEKPELYYRNNVDGFASLLAAMEAVQCYHLVYSSSATVYGNPAHLPIKEDAVLGYTNPYGQTKLLCEQMIASMHRLNPSWTTAILRYFNPVGAHDSGLIGEHPSGTPNNLMPYICQVAVGTQPYLRVFGSDYPTPDGTGIRDYIHVMDLAEGHVAALRHLTEKGESLIVNLGTGHGTSVIELVQHFEKASNRKIPYQILPRRSGDIASCYADAGLAQSLLGWKATRDLDAMCADAWRWQNMNPVGYV